MFSMAVAALAKSLIVVTVSLHPAAASPAPAHYTARPGDTLSDIARHEYGSAADWPALWWINRHAVPNPDVIAAGQRLRLSAWHPRPAWLDRAAWAAISVPAPPARPARAPTAAVSATAGPAPAPPAGTSPAGTSPAGTSPAGTWRAGTWRAGTWRAGTWRAGTWRAGTSSAAPGSFQACVIARESGGNARAVNPASGAGGLYGFLPGTWQSLGYSGLPQDAPVSVQNAAFQQAYAQSGTSPWAPSDGC
jgi:LysM repeat protein